MEYVELTYWCDDKHKVVLSMPYGRGIISPLGILLLTSSSNFLSYSNTGKTTKKKKTPPCLRLYFVDISETHELIRSIPINVLSSEIASLPSSLSYIMKARSNVFPAIHKEILYRTQQKHKITSRPRKVLGGRSLSITTDENNAVC